MNSSTCLIPLYDSGLALPQCLLVIELLSAPDFCPRRLRFWGQPTAFHNYLTVRTAYRSGLSYVSFWLNSICRKTTEMLKGFGRLQTYESLTCRNPRWAVCALWGFRISVGQSLCTDGCRTGYADWECSVLTVDSTVRRGVITPYLDDRRGAAGAHGKWERWPKRVCLGV